MAEVRGGPRGRARGAAAVLAAGAVLLVLAACGTWRPAGPASAPIPSATGTAQPDESGPAAALGRLYAVVDQLDGDPAAPISRLDAVAVGPARDVLASAVRHRRAADQPGSDQSSPAETTGATTTQLSQIVVRPAVRSQDAVSAAVQFCSSRQIDSGSTDAGQRMQPTTVTFRYQAGRWRAYTFGFDTPDCGCSQPVQCG